MLQALASSSGIDAILAGVLLEAVALLLYRRWRGGGVPAGALLANLAAGASLLLALRILADGSHATAVLCCLAVALIAHVGDLALRWQPRGTARVRA